MATHKQEHRPDAVEDLNEVPPEGIEPDLTPAPGTEPGVAGGVVPPASATEPGQSQGPVTPQGQRQEQSQSQSQGAGALQTQSQSQQQTQDDLGFDPESPDLADPQVDPVGAAEIPDDAPGEPVDKRVNDDKYPPYNKQ